MSKPIINIDFSKYHTKKLENCFNDNENKFRQSLYQYCIAKSQQEKFLTKLDQYQDQAPQDNYATQLEVNYQEVCENFIKEKFGFDLTAVDDVDIVRIYEKSKKQIGDDFERYVAGNFYRMSLLYFDEKMQDVAQFIKQEKAKIEKERIRKEAKRTLPIIKAELGTPPSPRQKLFIHNLIQDGKNKETGDRAEKMAYDRLVEEFGEENVYQISNVNDGLGYDIKYKNKNDEWKYVEVKTCSGNRFYLTENERQFAEARIDSYELFLVDENAIHKIENVDFSNKKQFTLTLNKFKVSYTINNHTAPIE